MNVLVPLSRFRVSYEVALGRPYSELEFLSLKCIAQGADSIEALSQVFMIPRRLLIEVLVTLTHAGWIAFGDSGFVLTRAGAAACTSRTRPSSAKIESRKKTVILERVTGGILPNSDVTFVQRRDFDEKQWDAALRLRAGSVQNVVDEGQVQGLLRPKQSEWVRWVGPIDMITKGGDWLLTEYDDTSGSVSGLPDQWKNRLTPYILENARHTKNPSFFSSRRVSATNRWKPRRETSIEQGHSWSRATISNDSLVVGTSAHNELLKRVFKQASSAILIVSSFVQAEVLERFQEQIVAAVERGVRVDILWGYKCDPDAMNLLKKLAYDTKRLQGAGHFRYNSERAGTHAKVLVWDESDEHFASIGSLNWLSAIRGELDDSPREISVLVHSRRLVCQVLRHCGAWWMKGDGGQLTAPAQYWRNTAVELDRRASTESVESDARPSGPENVCSARLILDGDSEALLGVELRSSPTRLLVVSHRLGRSALSRLPALEAREQHTDCELLISYGTTELASEEVDKARSFVQTAKGSLVRRPSCHAKVLVADDRVYIGSYNFLSADPFGRSHDGEELGLEIESPKIADSLWRIFEQT